MVTISAFEQRKNAQGEPFNALILEGDIIFVESQQTGNLYATAFRVSIPSTFNEAAAMKLVGRQLPGVINKVQAEPYEYTTKKGEVIVLSHTYTYSPNASNIEENVVAGNPEM